MAREVYGDRRQNYRRGVMASQKTVLTALLCFSLIVFVSIWLLTRNFPEKKCDCSHCTNEFRWTVGSRRKLGRSLPEDNTISSEIGQLILVISDYFIHNNYLILILFFHQFLLNFLRYDVPVCDAHQRVIKIELYLVPLVWSS